MKKSSIATLTLISLGLSLLNCSRPGEKTTSTNLTDESAIAIKVSPVETGEYSLPVISSGLISTENETKLSFKIGSIISGIYVKEGEDVTKGQLLASLDLTEINAQVNQAQNSLEKTKRDLERGQRLLKDSAATLEQIQNLQTAFEVADQNFRIAYFNRQFSTIRAVSSGKVIKKLANEGESITGGIPVLVINSAASNDWIVKIGLPDVDWVRVKRGDKAKIYTDAYPDDYFDGDLNVINEGADLVNGLYQAEVRVKPGNKKLASGLFARVEIIPSAKTKLQSIPIESIVEGQGKKAFVFVVNPDKKTVQKLPVTIAFLENQNAFIASGLTDISEVVSSGSGFLTENSAITVSKN